MQSRLWMPPSGDAPAISESFKAQLRAYEPSLLVTWHPRKCRFMIEQCVEHVPSVADDPKAHNHLCRRVFCMIVEDEEGDMINLGEHVIEKLRSIDTSRKYGTGPDALRRFIEESNRIDAEREEREERRGREIMHESVKDNRSWFNKAFDLIRRHDVARPHS